MNAFISYEIKAAAFYTMTGIMAPGKDDATNSHRYSERTDAWKKWHEDNGPIIEAMLSACSSFIE